MSIKEQANAVVRHDERGNTRLKTLIAGLIVLVVIIGTVWFATASGKKEAGDTAINEKQFQALFLTNGQVYFGKLSNLDGKYVTLSNIYYLQVQQSEGQSLQNASNSANTDNSKVSLAKLGNELHGPEDKMQVSSDQVLFWENLKDDSKVTQAIKKYQNQ